MTFYGYRRPDGRVGVRNRVLILPASVCATDTARIIAQQVEGAISFNNQQGCSQVAPDQQFTMDVMAGCRQPQYLRYCGGVSGLRKLPDGPGGQGH